MDDTKLFAKNKKESETSYIGRENIQLEHWDRRWHRKMCHAYNEKWETMHDG